jgi:hypothetical protein
MSHIRSRTAGARLAIALGVTTLVLAGCNATHHPSAAEGDSPLPTFAPFSVPPEASLPPLTSSPPSATPTSPTSTRTSSHEATPTPHPSSTATEQAPPKTLHPTPKPTHVASGPELIRGYVPPGAICDPQAEPPINGKPESDYWIDYDVILDVYGSTQISDWVLENPIQISTVQATKAIPGGVQLTFHGIATLSAPQDAPISIYGEDFVYNNVHLISLNYVDGPLSVSMADCPNPG